MAAKKIAEEWRPVKGYEGRYEVSNLGRVRSLPGGKRHGKVLCGNPGRGGYLSVTLCRGATRKQAPIHALVLTAFSGERIGNQQCAHRNHNRQDNRLSNLRWASPSENTQDRIESGFRLSGVANPNAALTDELVAEARRRYLGGETAKQIAESLPIRIHDSMLHRAIVGDSWSHVPEAVPKGLGRPNSPRRLAARYRQEPKETEA